MSSGGVMGYTWKVIYSYGRYDYRGKQVYYVKYFRTRQEVNKFLQKIQKRAVIYKAFIRGKTQWRLNVSWGK